MWASIVKFAILCAVVLAASHQPAVAVDMGESCNGAAELGISALWSAETHDHSLPGEPGGDSAHHHHCPMVLDLDGANRSDEPVLASQVHFPSPAGPLTSRATAPPIDPPLA